MSIVARISRPLGAGTLTLNFLTIDHAYQSLRPADTLRITIPLGAGLICGGFDGAEEAGTLPSEVFARIFDS